jgi:hypothetical protein
MGSPRRYVYVPQAKAFTLLLGDILRLLLLGHCSSEVV